ncbi:MAG: histidine phosphatase family protein [Chitinophagales bacterium]|nr:histidine phosphatase family protein [Chitinophagales bacterium]MDW8427595.1 histidine phosphatase family protein [Chitinophagales bacterium]
MKTLVLVRHAKSSWKDPELADIERPLNERGQREAPLMASIYRQQRLLPDLIASSTAVRALTTAEIFAQHLDYERQRILRVPELYMAEDVDLLEFVHNLDDGWETVMLVGHNDGLSHFANRLLAGEEIGSMPTCAVAALEFLTHQWKNLRWHEGRLRFYLHPKMWAKDD